MSWLIEPWQSGIVARSGIALVIVGVLGGVLGVFVVIRDMAFTTEAFAHTAFPGAVLAAAAGESLLLGGLAAVLAAAAGMLLAARSDRVSDEAAVSVVFTGLFAVGALALALLGPLDRDVTSFLFGSLFATTTADLVTLGIAAVAILAVLWALRRPLVAASFDRDFARSAGMRVGHTDLAVTALLAVGVVAAFQTVGNVLVLALFVTPAVTARALTGRLGSAITLAAAIGVLSALLGLYVSYHASVAAGASVVLTATSLLLVVLVVRRVGAVRSGQLRSGRA